MRQRLSQAILFDHRSAFRPQVLVPPFSFMADLPPPVRDDMMDAPAQQVLLGRQAQPQQP